MNLYNLPFVLHGETFTCNAFTDSSEYPCLVFIMLKDKILIEAFGEGVTLKTDFDSLLPKKGDYPQLTALRQSILDVLQKMPEWMTERIALKPLVGKRY